MDPKRVDQLMSELEEFAAGRERGETRPDERSSPPEKTPSYHDALGEEAELRRALEVLEELIELRPDDLDLHARKLRYLRRLGMEERRTELECQLARRLASEGKGRAARLLCRVILNRDPGHPRAREILTSVAAADGGGLLPPLGDQGNGMETAQGFRTEDSPRDLAWRELESRVVALPWLCRARRKLDEDGETPGAYRDYAQYLRLRGRADEACEILTFLLDDAADDVESGRDVRTALVECLLERGRDGEAREHLEVLARRDEAFGLVLIAVPGGGR